jgi:hypothetical protein
MQPSACSLVTNIQGGIRPFATRMHQWVTCMAKKAKKAMGFDLSAKWTQHALPPVAVLAGAVAFGFWWNSINAGLFACFALFFLAGIYNALRQVSASLSSERDGNTSSIANRSHQNLDASSRAIEHLRPWVEDRTSLTEESAKACCAILLDTLATLHPKFAK